MTDRPNKYTCTKLLVTSFTILIFVGKNCFCQYLMPKTLYESMHEHCLYKGRARLLLLSIDNNSIMK